MTHRPYLQLASLPLLFLSLALAGGCKKQTVTSEAMAKPDYAHKLGPGESALRKITDPARMPDLAAAYQSRDFYLDEALDQSTAWFGAPSSKTFFPFEKTITWDQARASIYAFRQTLQSASNETEFADDIKKKFDVYESVGYNNEGIVLFTGYYSPIFHASKTRTAEYTFPLYKRPADLVTDPVTGEIKGRKTAGGTAPYPTRKEIESSGMLHGTELVWMRDALDAYIIHVNGSAKLLMPDDSVMYIGYAGKNGQAYKGLGTMMVDAGLIKSGEVSLPAIKRVYNENPQRVIDLINQNDSYVFFQPYDESKWPSGSLGVKVSPEASLATDKKIYPRGGVAMVDTKAVTISAGQRKFQRFLLDQDTGGAIQAPGRADIYMGWARGAEILAGGQYAEGRLYYFFVKPEFVDEYLKMIPPPRAGKTTSAKPGTTTPTGAKTSPAKTTATPEK